MNGDLVRRLLVLMAVLALTSSLVARGPSQSPLSAPAPALSPQSSELSPDALDLLRVDYARRFFSADAHLRLAKYFAEHGQPLVGFHISEEARQDHFSEEDFLRAVRTVYRNEPPDFPAPPTAQDAEPPPDSLAAWRAKAAAITYQDVASATATIDEALAKFPQDGELHFHKAGLLHDQKKLAEAAVSYELAASLAPKSAYIQAWTARFFLKGLGDRDRALRYYFAAYFLDPNFHETEYVDERIRSITKERGAAELARRLKAKVPLAALVVDPDPVVVKLAIEAAERLPRGDLMQPVTLLLANDDPTVRYAAARLLGRYLSRKSDPWLRQTLTGKPQWLAGVEWTPGRELYVRSAAAYVAGAKFGFRVVPLIEAWLDDPVELMRYDAISVLAEYGGATGMHRLKKLHASGKVRAGRMKLLLDGLFAKK